MPSVLDLLEGRTIFLTGGTGFVGKVLIEKLLRCASGLRSIYVLVRPSKGRSASERIQKEVISSPVFNRLRSEIGETRFHALVQKKIIAASGDLAQQNLGLSNGLLDDIKANVNVIVHSAASVDFNLRLDLAVEQNVYGTMRVLDVADACHELIAFVHISTAYTNCTQPSGAIVSERLYPCPFEIHAMLSTISRFSSRELQKVTVDGLIGDWPNTYTFTKFITEHLIHERCFGRCKYAVSVVRPTMIGAAWLEPVPGWIDVISAAGAIYVAGALGVLKILPGNPDHIGDIVPVDFVINAVILSISAAVNHPNKFFICQAAASVCKPWRWRQAIETLPPFFRTHMSEHAISQNLSFKMVSNQTLYELEFLARYGIPSAVLNALALIGTKSQKRNAEQFQRLVMKMSFIVNAFRYFTENEWRFESKNLFSTLNGQPAKEAEIFWLDLSQLDYSHYHKTFAYGLLKFVLKEDLIEVGDPRMSRQVSLNGNGNGAGTGYVSRLLPHLSWAMSHLKQQHSVSGPNISQMRTAVLNSPHVQSALTALTEREPDVSPAQASAHASHLLDIMIGETRPAVLVTMAAMLKKLFGRLYEDILVNLPGIERVREAAKDDIPMIYVPTHRSYMDFLLVSYLCFIHRLPIPYITAGDDFLELAVVRWLFRHSGAFFIRRSFHGDELYKVLFSEYVRQLLCLGKSLEFFIEGSRSRSGKMVHPKLGMLRTVTNTVMNGDIRDAYIIPIAINYEKTLEGSSYSKELQGSSKMKETLRNLIGASSSVLNSQFGRVSIHLGEPISIRAQLMQGQDLRTVTKSMGYRVSWELQNAGEIMPTHMLATLLLMYRRGISETQLALKFDWLRREIRLRSGRLCFFESEKHEWLVRRSIDLLRDLTEERHHNVFEPKISQRSDYPNMLLLGHYRNKIVHVFFREAIWACAFHSIGLDSSEGVDCGLLFTSATFLFSLIKREILTSPNSVTAEDFDSSFNLMLSRGEFRLLPNGRVEIASEAMFSFLCALCWPFIDSYYVTGLLLHTLEGSHEEHQVILRTQWLATTLYHESMICFYESCSGDTLRNALTAFHEEFGIIDRTRKHVDSDKRKKNSLEWAQPQRHRTEISINPKFQDGVELQQLIHRIDLLRKRPPVVRTSLRRAMIAEIPLLAKL